MNTTNNDDELFAALIAEIEQVNKEGEICTCCECGDDYNTNDVWDENLLVCPNCQDEEDEEEEEEEEEEERDIVKKIKVDGVAYLQSIATGTVYDYIKWIYGEKVAIGKWDNENNKIIFNSNE
jgi:hypothetical protein